MSIIGSFGKTTTTRAVAAALGTTEHPWVQRSFNAWSFVPLLMLRQARSGGPIVLEVGIGAPGQMAGYAASLRPDLVVVTSIGSEHLSAFQNLEHLRDEKAHMVRGMRASGAVVLNRDDPNVMWMASQSPGRVVTFGFDPSADVVGEDVVLEWPQGSLLTVHVAGRVLKLRSPLMGKPMMYALLAAIAVAHTLGRDLDGVVERLGKLSPTRGRLEPVKLTGGAIALRDDCKSPWETMACALEFLGHVPAGRRIAVLGGIDSEPSYYNPIFRALGAQCAKSADQVVLVGLGRKRSNALRLGASREGMAEEAIASAGTVHDAIALLGDMLGPEDVVLLKGRRNQRLERIGLALAGGDVRCRVVTCELPHESCRDCPRLRG